MSYNPFSDSDDEFETDHNSKQSQISNTKLRKEIQMMLKISDLGKTSSKKARQQLQEKLGIDLTDRKVEVNRLVNEVISDQIFLDEAVKRDAGAVTVVAEVINLEDEEESEELVAEKAAEEAKQKNKIIKEARLEFLQHEITRLEQELKCPVCFDPCTSPIYSCDAQHMVCSTCRPQLDKCPECRARYRNLGRHRYAERDHASLVNIQVEQELLLQELQQEG